MKRLPLMLLLVTGLAATTAHAQTATGRAPVAPSAPAEDAAKATPDAPAPTTHGDSDKKRVSDANCLRHTGSRITQRDGKPRCTSQAGRAYTKDDIDRTGHTNLADALRTLDPAFN